MSRLQDDPVFESVDDSRLQDEDTALFATLDDEPITNIFCPTGAGGGVDPSCSAGPRMGPDKGAGGGGGGGSSSSLPSRVKDSSGNILEVTGEEGNFYVGKDDLGREGIKVYKPLATVVDGPKPAAKKQAPKKKLPEAPKMTRDEVANMSVTQLKKQSVPAGEVKMHGMDSGEKMRVVNVDGVDVKFAAGSAKSAKETLANSADVHPELWKQNKSLVFSTKGDKQAEAIAKRNGLKEFESNASGGDGNIVVYNKLSMSSDVLAHESAHNLAQNTWGKATPKANSSFGKEQQVKVQGTKQRVTNAVTEYGQWSKEEDFAEYVTAYNKIVVQGKSEYRGATLDDLQKRPKSFKAVEKMLKE